MRPRGLAQRGKLDGPSACLVVTEQRNRNGGIQAGWFNGMSGVAIPRDLVSCGDAWGPRLALFSFDSKKKSRPSGSDVVSYTMRAIPPCGGYNLNSRQNKRHGVSG